MSERFQPVRVFHRGPTEIAHIRDTRAGRDLFVARLGGKFGNLVDWGRLNAPVLNQELRAVGAKALATKRAQTTRGSVAGRDARLTKLAKEGLTRDQITKELGYADANSVTRRLKQLETRAGAGT